MRNFLSFVLGILFFSNLSVTGPADTGVLQELKQQTKQLQVLESYTDSLTCQIDSLEASISDPVFIRSAYADLITSQTLIPGSRFTMRDCVNPLISKKLYLALVEYQGPNLLVSSGRRDHNPRSDHFSGDAIDISAKSSKALITYLESTSGKEWLKEHNLGYYIEDRTNSSFLNAFRSPFVFLNRNASGPHIHVYVK